MGKLDGKVALITGGSDGIGLATAQRFVAEGAYVFITGRRKEMLDKAVEKIGKKNVTAIQADAAKLDQIDNVYQIIKKEKGKFDILFANAAIADFVPLTSVTEKHFDDIFNINVKGILFTVQKALPIFNDGGSIILTGSVGGSKGVAAASVYSASKAAIRSFARCWTVDLKDRKIRVNVLSPGPIETAMLRQGTDDKSGSGFGEAIKQIIEANPMGRAGQPDEVATAAVFLASDDSSYITGIELFIDGGAGQI
jgi:NAD(P)-dependent dehydrogenase (short-subunit alcohol dehydrogenase family)